MQEGPNWYWQDYPLEQQIWYFNTIQEADFMFVHNESDKKYYKGLTGKECKILPSLMIEDSIKDLPQVERNNIIAKTIRQGQFTKFQQKDGTWIMVNDKNVLCIEVFEEK